MRMIDNGEVGLKKQPEDSKLLYLELHNQECVGSLLPEGAW